MTGKLDFAAAMTYVPLFFAYTGWSDLYSVETFTLDTYNDEMEVELLSVPAAEIDQTVLTEKGISASAEERRLKALEEKMKMINLLFR